MNERFLPYSRQEITEEDIAEVARVLRGDWLTTGPEVGRFEEALASYCGARYAVVCANGTAALHLAMMALDVQPGDGVVTSPITFLATANAARFVGADVHFADVNPLTINLDPHEVERVLARDNGRIKVVLPVHFGGHPARMEEFAALAAKHGVSIVEDACHALGAEYRDNSGEMVRVGSCRHSAMTVFSFHPVKGITTGEGGAVTTNDRALYERMLLFRGHGMVRNEASGFSFQNADMAHDDSGNVVPWYYEMQALGYNYRITDFQCALGRSQLAKVDHFLAAKARLAECYRAGLAESPRLSALVKPLGGADSVRHAWHLFVVQVDFDGAGVSRPELVRRLHAKGVGTQVHYIPLHLQPYYRQHAGLKRGDLPVAEAYYERCLSLPLFPSMTEPEVDRVVAALQESLA
ncbi:MAG: UDP-4-amino-4,6-dideoxy-N-acetyl-beta-L-altrosamine transaminase [Desulfurivibrionaceae bacterium]